MNRITNEQYALIRPHLPVQRGNVRISNLTFSLSGGNAHDAPEGRALLEGWSSARQRRVPSYQAETPAALPASRYPVRAPETA